MERWGQCVCLTDGTWRSAPYKAFLQSLRYKNKMYLKEIQTPIGTANQNYYLYIGPYDHALAGEYGKLLLQRDTDSFAIVKHEAVYAGDTVCYNWAVVRRLEEGGEA